MPGTHQSSEVHNMTDEVNGKIDCKQHFFFFHSPKTIMKLYFFSTKAILFFKSKCISLQSIYNAYPEAGEKEKNALIS